MTYPGAESDGATAKPVAMPDTDDTSEAAQAQREHDITLKRFDYSWDWFKVHAKQRTDVFNYFLIITGLLANAYVNLRREGHWIASGAVAATGLLTGLGFYLLDVRNKYLVDSAGTVLDEVEKETLFNTPSTSHLGLSQRRNDHIHAHSPAWINTLFAHSFVFRGLHLTIAIMWIVFLYGPILFWARHNGYVRLVWDITALLVPVASILCLWGVLRSSGSGR